MASVALALCRPGVAAQLCGVWQAGAADSITPSAHGSSRVVVRRVVLSVLHERAVMVVSREQASRSRLPSLRVVLQALYYLYMFIPDAGSGLAES